MQQQAECAESGDTQSCEEVAYQQDRLLPSTADQQPQSSHCKAVHLDQDLVQARTCIHIVMQNAELEVTTTV